MASEVYFAPLSDGASAVQQAKATAKVYDASGFGRALHERDFVAIKVHVSEKMSKTYMRPQIIKKLVDKVRECKGNPFITETSTLYKGERENAVKHLLLAHRHGFGIEKTGAPFIMADGLLGNTEAEVAINGELFDRVKIAGEIISADGLIAVAHVTGHLVSGLGACIKTLGMGLASRKGKMRQHSAMKPEVNRELCRFCRKCLRWCPRQAVSEKGGKAFIALSRCIGCGECLAVCRYDAIKYDWGKEAGFMQKSMAEYALGVILNKREKCLFINLLTGMTPECDCMNTDERFVADIGVLASTDAVAIDKATLDLTARAFGKSVAELSHPKQDALIQIAHGEKIGLGSMSYELIKIS
ncbi:MAG: DUF362 domain-containing protein [Candidatus Eremiobacteraeota bacterium]|nr:DUF362 domain-containing protein [Candidatus Eremiobacteraeota bacterium]